MESMIATVTTSLTTVIGGIILFLCKRFLTAVQQREKRHEEEKRCGDELIIRTLAAIGKLSVATGTALRDGKTNGEMTAALQEYRAVEDEVYRHLVSCYASRGN